MMIKIERNTLELLIFVYKNTILTLLHMLVLLHQLFVSARP